MNNSVMYGCASIIITAYLWLKYYAIDIYVHIKCKSGCYTAALFSNYGIISSLYEDKHDEYRAWNAYIPLFIQLS